MCLFSAFGSIVRTLARIEVDRIVRHACLISSCSTPCVVSVKRGMDDGSTRHPESPPLTHVAGATCLGSAAAPSSTHTHKNKVRLPNNIAKVHTELFAFFFSARERKDPMLECCAASTSPARISTPVQLLFPAAAVS
jgi:hypothetical protein